MKEKLAEDLKKYEAEIEEVNKRLAAVDEQRLQLITHGRRVEGIVAYLRTALSADAKPVVEAEVVETVPAK